MCQGSRPFTGVNDSLGVGAQGRCELQRRGIAALRRGELARNVEERDVGHQVHHLLGGLAHYAAPLSQGFT